MRGIRRDPEALREALNAAASVETGLPVELDGLPLTDAFDLLGEVDAPCAYFSSRSGARESLALGRAELRHFAETSSTAEILAALDGRGPWFGGFRFDPEQLASVTWSGFGAAYFFRPLVLLERRAGETRLEVDAASGEDGRARAYEALLPLLGAAPPDEEAPSPAVARAGSSEAWRRAFEDALSALDAGELEKVVLAQSASFELARSARIGRALKRCRVASPDCFRFALRTEPGCVFATNSPELLMRSHGTHIETEALAGTRPAAQSAELLEDDKELREQRFVTDAIRARLEACNARSIEIQGPAPRAHGSLAHLATTFRAELDGDARDLISILHPTPAVCGSPRPRALRFLRDREGLDRGLYAGGVGVVRAAEIELAVALRSVLLQGRTATLFAGGGIVRGSRADAEAREIEQKNALWRKLLTDAP